MCPFGRGDVKSRCNDERPCKFSQGKTPPRICLSDYPDVLLLAFLLILSSSSVVGFSYLKAQSLSMKHLMLGSTGAFLQEHCKKKKKATCSLLCIRVFFLGQFWSSVVCISFSVQQLQYFGKMNRVCRCLLNKCRFCMIACQIFLC